MLSRNTKTTSEGLEAERLYERHFTVFPDAPELVQDRYFYAELLWSLAERERDPARAKRRWADAEKALSAYPKTPCSSVASNRT